MLSQNCLEKWVHISYYLYRDIVECTEVNMTKESRFSLVLENRDMKSDYEKSDVPYKMWGDMVIGIRHILLENQSTLQWEYVTNKLLNELGCTFEELYNKAYKEDERHGYVMRGLLEQIGNNPLLRKTKADKYKKLSEHQQIFILTNEENVNGATVMLHKEFLTKAADKLKGGLVIAAMSTHQVLCISEKAPNDLKKTLEKMLKDETKKDKSLSTELIYWFPE